MVILDITRAKIQQCSMLGCVICHQTLWAWVTQTFGRKDKMIVTTKCSTGWLVWDAVTARSGECHQEAALKSKQEAVATGVQNPQTSFFSVSCTHTSLCAVTSV